MGNAGIVAIHDGTGDNLQSQYHGWRYREARPTKLGALLWKSITSKGMERVVKEGPGSPGVAQPVTDAAPDPQYNAWLWIVKPATHQLVLLVAAMATKITRPEALAELEAARKQGQSPARLYGAWYYSDIEGYQHTVVRSYDLTSETMPDWAEAETAAEELRTNAPEDRILRLIARAGGASRVAPLEYLVRQINRTLLGIDYPALIRSCANLEVAGLATRKSLTKAEFSITLTDAGVAYLEQLDRNALVLKALQPQAAAPGPAPPETAAAGAAASAPPPDISRIISESVAQLEGEVQRLNAALSEAEVRHQADRETLEEVLGQLESLSRRNEELERELASRQTRPAEVARDRIPVAPPPGRGPAQRGGAVKIVEGTKAGRNKAGGG